jgi:restriction system protein
VARRKKSSPLEDWAQLIALLPWWAGVALAVVFYLVLHRVAVQPVAAMTQPAQVGTLLAQSVWKTLASVGQYLLPLICLAGAAVSAWRRRQRKTLVHDIAQSKAADALDGMSWREFEMLVGEAFRLQGYAVMETGGAGADGGIDLVLRRDGEKSLVQCKQWKAYKVGVDVVRELFGVMAATGAAGGFVVTSGRFTDEATNFASGRNIKLVDGPKLHELIRRALAARRQPVASAGDPLPVRDQAAPVPPACPTCAKPMVKRLAKRGANAGGEFWGCTGYPACKGVRPL